MRLIPRLITKRGVLLGRPYRLLLFGGVITLGTVLLYIGTLGLYPLDGGFMPQRDLFRTRQDLPATGYEVMLQNNLPDVPYSETHISTPWYLALKQRPGWGIDMRERSEVPTTVYTRTMPLAGEARQREGDRTYNTLRGTQLGGLASLLVGAVGLVRPSGPCRKI